jgi:hypothetical protein
MAILTKENDLRISLITHDLGARAIWGTPYFDVLQVIEIFHNLMRGGDTFAQQLR